MRIFYILTLILALSACSVQSPFMDTNPSMQTVGATSSSDPERVLGSSYVTIKALRNGTEKEYILGLADVLDTLAEGNLNTNVIETSLKKYVATKAKYPEDKLLANYFIAKLGVKTTPLALPISPEQKRVLSLYAKTLRDTVNDFKE